MRHSGFGLLCVSAILALPLRADGPVWPGPRPSGEVQLPNGRLLTPAGTQTPVGPYPFALSVTPNGRRVVVASMGTSDQALQLLDARDGRQLAVSLWGGASVPRPGTPRSCRSRRRSPRRSATSSTSSARTGPTTRSSGTWSGGTETRR